MQPRLIDDYVNDLVPIPETRKCDKCGAWTWWAGPKQRTLGRCWDCVAGIGTAQCTPEQDMRALALLLTAFPGSTLGLVTTPRYAPDTYAGPDAGPCAGCGGITGHRRHLRRHGVIRRYGSDAYLFCLACRPLTEEGP